MREILILLTNNYPFGSGEEFLESEIPILSKKFKKIILVSNNKNDPITRKVPKNVEIYRFPKGISFSLNLKLLKVMFFEISNLFPMKKSKLKKYLAYSLKVWGKRNFLKNLLSNEDFNNTIIYSYWADNSLMAGLLLKNNFQNLKVVSRVHSIDLYEFRQNDNYLPFRTFIYNEIDKIFAISEQGKEYLLSKYSKHLENKIGVSRLGTIRNELNNNKIEVNNKKDTLNIISCSYIVPVKRLHLIIEELSLIDNININWIHIGSGELFNEMLNLAEKKLASKSNISYSFKGYMRNEEIFQLYNQTYFDLFINVSEIEGIPVSFMEAFSFGIPIIATNVGGVSEIVNKNNGYLIDRDFKRGTIKQCINDFYNLDLRAIEELRENAFQTWRDQYNAINNYQSFCDTLINEI